MLTIRRQQLRVFELYQQAKFEEDIATHLTRRFRDNPLVANPSPLRDFVRGGLDVARGYGIVSRYDLRKFLEFRMEYGADFHLRPWAAKILDDRTLSGAGKIEQLDDYSLFALRHSAHE